MTTTTGTTTRSQQSGSDRAGYICLAVLFLLGAGGFWWLISPGPSTTTATTKSDVSAAAADTVYVSNVLDQAPDLRSTTAKTISDAGRSVCTDTTNGTTLATTATRLTSAFGAQDAGIIIGLAPAAYCPDQQDAIDAALKTLG